MSSVYPPAPHLNLMNGRSEGTTDRRKKRPSNTGSKLLTQSENESFYAILPFDNFSLCAAVAEIIQGQPEERRWVKLHRGVISLVKDYQTRAYFLRLYDIQNRTMLWELRMYKNFAVVSYVNCTGLLTFESEDGRVFGLNFASPDEAVEFRGHIDKRNEQERRSTTHNPQRESSRTGSAHPPSFAVQANGARPIPTQSSFNASGVTVAGSIAPSPASQTVEKESRGFLGLRTRKKDKKQRIRKEDISNPTNFEHKAHVGWDQDNGFSNAIYDLDHVDDSVAQIIRAAGMDSAGMDKKTIKFVYDFIDTYQRENQLPVASIQNFATPSYKQPAPLAPLNNWGSSTASASPTPAPPPPPSRVASVQQSAPVRPPPPPPSQSSRMQRPLPQVPVSPVGSRPDGVPPPPPPPPPLSNSTVPPPPPPPIPPISGGPPPPALDLDILPAPQTGRGNLLAEIQAGKTLRSVGNTQSLKSNGSGGGDARGDVMAQIRQGAQLKKVDVVAEQEKRKSAQGGLTDMGGIAGALARALAERRQNMGSDDSESDDDEKNEWSD